MAVRRRRTMLAVLLAAVVAGAVLLLSLGGGEAEPSFLQPFGDGRGGGFDPYGYVPDRQADFERRAAAGLAHPLYVHSPGGVEATARRVARYRALVEPVAEEAGVSADLLEALIFLESGGRPDAQAGDLEGAVGLTQILAETATGMLGMRVDVARSTRLTRAIARGRDVTRNRRLRRAVDERFDPPKAITAAGRYLALALDEFGREDLAFESYHMGIGNLQDALARYGEDDIPYAELFFDSSPVNHTPVWEKLASLGDDSPTYLWRVFAAREIMRLARQDPGRLSALAAAHGSPDGAAAALRLERPVRRGRPVAPDTAQLARAGVRLAPGASGRLRPVAAELLQYLGEGVRQIARTQPLVVAELAPEGDGFAVRRRYRSRGQAQAFQFALDRLTAMNRIAWSRERGAIDVTVAGS